MDNAHYTYITLYIMNDNFKPLDCDEDVLLFNQDAFIIARLRQLIESILSSKFNTSINQVSTTVINVLNGTEIRINDNFILGIPLGNLHWISKSMNCQLLKVGTKGWQAGKVRIQAEIFCKDNKWAKVNVVVEFCPDEPLEPESPLDDLRKLIQDG